ncbi:uncharacterized protein LOC118184445 isoform X2 [Stegodyphus dumicola]|uniref:uncharacterized protein LOC118184445 isoform X1 n=1 Tax=Stegodyphus dumicola TaxID=202533 RepID=UPI0015AAABAA|nr:uncharacterized protein LOC118184445 isoform X1 [Stegodyphus dumicola]XP_035210005.1 uncharacterized protein LOC118184445 isoform X2 [Stegodyphus dumicola]
MPRNNYAYNTYLYCGKDSDGISVEESWKKFSKPSQAVLRLSKPIFNTNRNVTADNWFSSIELTTELLKNGLTYVGTVKKEIPKDFLLCKSRKENSTLYGFTKDITLISFVPKKRRAVVLMSSLHHSIETDSETQKPEIIGFYNRTKGGVDALDEKCSVHSCSRRRTRWPMALFYRLVDMSIVNAYILHQGYNQNPAMTRMVFLKELVKPLLHTRVKNPRINRELRLTIKRILGKEAESKNVEQCTKEAKLKPTENMSSVPPKQEKKDSIFMFGMHAKVMQ